VGLVGQVRLLVRRTVLDDRHGAVGEGKRTGEDLDHRAAAGNLHDPRPAAILLSVLVLTMFHAGIVPTSAQLDRMSDESLIEHLVQVRGIGRWTVEMLLMFRLGRADVLPVDDLGVRKGAQIVHGFEEMPPPRMLREFGERWAPYRTLAAFYLWRVVDAANPPKPGAKPVKRSQD